MASALTKPAIAPAFYSIEEWVETLTGLSNLSGLPLLAELYATHQSLLGEEADTFEEFTQWGQSVLGDFNEVERYNLDPSQVFSNLREAKVLERWGLMPEEEPTELMENYMDFWEHLLPLYTAFNQRLLDSGKAYQGQAFRTLANRLDLLEPWLTENGIRGVYLVGFNALNACEEKVFRHLLKTSQAEILWDLDSYYADPPHQEAGLFIRKYLEEWSELESAKLQWITNDWNHSPKDIEAFGVSGSFAQAQKVAEILSKIPDDALQNQRVAVVLADEGLLVPVVDALPSNVQSFNITMGMPLRDTPLATFFLQLISLLEKREKSGGKNFYYTDLIRWLEQPPVGQYFLKRGLSAKATIQKIHRNNWVYISLSDLLRFLPELKDSSLESLLEEGADIANWLKAAQDFFVEYAKNQSSDPLEAEAAYKMYSLSGQLKDLVQQYPFLSSFVQLRPFLMQSIGDQTLDFVGEPLVGLQILGILETRLLDFDHVIMTSVNEGILPKGKTPGSMIPLDLKKGFGLPTHKEKDAVYAYHFYRLLQGARKISLIYNAAPADIGTTEPSRFILQLQREWGWEPHQNFTLETADTFLPSNVTDPKYSVAKTPELLKELEEIAFEKGLSPSSITSYINNPLTFYKQRVLRISEADEVEETIGDNTMGSYLHEVLETLYQPFVDGSLQITEEDIKKMAKDFKPLLFSAFRKDFSEKSLATGKNHLIYNVAVEMLSTYFKVEGRRLSAEAKKGNQHYAIGLEEEIICPLTSGEKPILLKGLIDRIDRCGEVTHIYDYKTGSVDPTKLKVTSRQNLRAQDGGREKAIQLLCYGWMYTSIHPHATITLSIIGLRRSGVTLPLTLDGKSQFTRSDLEPFMEAIFDTANEILNPETPFVLNPKSKY